MPSVLRVTLIAAAVAVLATPLAAQRRTVVRGPKGNLHVVHPRKRILFRTNDRLIFRNYYRTQRIVVAPLRLELARLVVVGSLLPVEIVRTPVPADLVVLLAPPPTGYQYLIVGNRVVLLDDEGTVSDILDDVFP